MDSKLWEMRKKINTFYRESPIKKFLTIVETLEQQFLSNRFLNWIFKHKRPPYRNIEHPPHWAIDMFVLTDIFIALLLICIVPHLTDSIFVWLLLIPISWALYRIIEIVLFTLFALLTSHEGNIYNKGRMLILLILNYFEIIIWFAFFYHILYILNKHLFLIKDGINIVLDSYGSLYFSIVTMTTLGYGDITPNSTLTMIIISIQTLIGLYIALIILGWFIQFFKTSKNKNRFRTFCRRKF